MTFSPIADNDQLLAAPEPDALSAWWAQPTLYGIRWPSAAVLAAARLHVDGIPALEEAREETCAWIRRVLRPVWIPADLRERLIAARAITDGFDAFLVRYRAAYHALQILAPESCLHVTVRPPDHATGSPLLWLGHLMYALVQAEVRWDRVTWQAANMFGLQHGHQRSNGSTWVTTLSWLTDGAAVRFTVAKLQAADGPPKARFARSDDAQQRWLRDLQSP